MSKEHYHKGHTFLTIKIKAENLRERRREKGLTQTALARKLGITRSAVKHWEIGEGISEGNLENLCQLLKCYPEDISIVREINWGTKTREKIKGKPLGEIKCWTCPNKGTIKCHERYCEVMLCWMIFCAAILPNDYKPKLAEFLGLGGGYIPSRNEIKYGRT